MTTRLTTTPEQGATALSDMSDPAEAERVGRLIESAKREGSLSWIGVQFSPDRAEPIIEDFKRYYGLESLEVEYSYTPTGEIIKRVEEGLRNQSNVIDVVWTSSPAWYRDLLRRGEIMRYESPFYRDYSLSDRNGMSEPGYWVSDAYTFIPLYNPSSVERHGIRDFKPESWSDFADPRLLCAISMIDVAVSTTAAPVLAGITKAMGDEWLEKLGRNKLTLHARGGDGREGVGSGEHAITMFGTPADTLALLERGIKVQQIFPKEGVVLIPFTPIILNRAPHSSAARLFIDFVRSPHGTQMAMATKGEALIFFGRPGVTSTYPHLLPASEDVVAIPFDWDAEATNEAIETFREKARRAGIVRNQTV
ncbi:extracellular solute-binding protein [Bradyrhizobium sp. 41S5]|uniref:ABC transporter substrate-binding protein n=1 Tax=Bradyrhizobium sp. 41S5 TaxID=1404443 RepID=UPI00156B7C9D|nr:extracellular solute-binding protein [Bradyrhizobium sp. 41S5]UFX42757.1 extracellular solute-binding protein [Bradyrhizobium sp. 41S5]